MRLAEQGLRPQDVGLIPAAAGGPKGLILNGLDRFLFGHWLPQASRPVHLLGASIGAWRMATAATAWQAQEADAAFVAMAEAYIGQRYDPEPGEKRPRPNAVSQSFARILAQCFEGQESRLLAHPQWRPHLVTSRGRGFLLAREGAWRTPLGYLGAFAANAVGRPQLGRWLERVVFSDPRAALPLAMKDFPSREVQLSAANLRPAILASCSIPFWLSAQTDLPGAPSGTYWDGGMTDYHLHFDYRALQISESPLVLYPHFQRAVIPGWLDKAFKRRHASSPFLDNVVLLAPNPDWVRSLPAQKLPDRNDFVALAHDVPERQRRWRTAVAQSERLADEFAALVRQPSIQALPL